MANLCVVTFCLNEEKFLRYAINSWLTGEKVIGVVVVEGAVRSLKKYATSKGLSKDKTGEIVKQLQKTHTRGSDIHYRAHGWAADKAELQNAGLKMARDIRGVGWIVLAGSDELYTKADLDRLAITCDNTAAGVLCPTFRHFWRRPDLIAVGSSWGVKMHRIYRTAERMQFSNHAAPPFSGGARKQELNDVFVYHYAGMQDQLSIDAKLDLYRQRDGHRLTVTDTWSNWQWGERTQWTHGAGSAEVFGDKHPAVIADDIWGLLPRSNGELKPLPPVPWEKKAKVGIVTDDSALQIAAVKQALEQMVRHFDVQLFAPSDIEIGGVKSKPFDVRELDECGVSVCASRVVLRDLCKMNIRLAIDQSGVRGYDAVVDRDDPNALVAETLRLLANWPDAAPKSKGQPRDIPKGKDAPYSIPKGKKTPQKYTESFGIQALDRRIVPKRPLVVTTGTRGRAIVAQVGRTRSDKLPVNITNNTKSPWVSGTHVIQAVWLDNTKANPIRDAPRTSMIMPYAVVPGAVLSVDIPVPMPPITGMLYLSVDVIEVGRKRLNVGPVVQVRTVL